MAYQVKFYSVDSFSSDKSINENGIYFLGNGKLYKGSQRFGANKVSQSIASAPSDDVMSGDIYVSSEDGNTYAYNGVSWVKIATAPSNVLSGLDFDFIGDSSDTTSIVTSIKQENGKVTATAKAFPRIQSPSDGSILLNGTTTKLSGWSSLKTRVSDLETWQSSVTGDNIVDGTQLTAESGKFKNLTVTDTATFSATSVTASTLAVADEDAATFGGSTISEIADRQIAAISSVTKSATDDGVTVSVTTKSGSVDTVAVAVDATSSAADIKTDADATKLARAKDVADAIAGLTGAMHFRGVFASTEAVTDPKNGDIILVGTKEYVYSIPEGQTSGSWVELGDETQVGNLVTYTGYNTELTTSATTLAGAVNELDAEINGMDSSFTVETDNGVAAKLTQVDGKITEFDVTVDAIESAAGIVTGEDQVVTAGAVADKIANIVDGLDSTVSASSKGVEITVEEEDGKLTSATLTVTAPSTMEFDADGSPDELATTAAVKSFFDNNLVWLDAEGVAISDDVAD